MTTVAGTKVTIAPKSILSLFLAFTVLALVAMAAYGTARYLAAKGKQAKDMALAATSPMGSSADAFEVEA